MQFSFVGNEKVNNLEFCKLKVTSMVCFCNDAMHFFISSLITSTLNNFFEGNMDPIFFIHV